MIFTKEYASTSDEQVEMLSRYYNIHYRACMGSLSYILSTRVDLCLEVHKLEFFSSNPGRVHFEGLVHLLRYIRYNTNLGLKYYAKIEVSPLPDLLRQDNIKAENQLMVLSDSSWQYCQETGRSKGAYIVFYHVVPIDHCTHVPGPVAQSTAESKYNVA